MSAGGLEFLVLAPLAPVLLAGWGIAAAAGAAGDALARQRAEAERRSQAEAARLQAEEALRQAEEARRLAEAERQRKAAEERRRQEDAALRQRCQTLASTLAGLGADLGKFGSKLPKPVSIPGADRAAAGGQACAFVTAAYQTYEADLTNAIAAARQQLTQVMAKDLVGKTGLAHDQIADESRKVVELLSQLDNQNLRSKLIDQAELVMGMANRAQAETALLDLKTEASAALEAESYGRLAVQTVQQAELLTDSQVSDLLGQAQAVRSNADFLKLKTTIRHLVKAQTDRLAELERQADEKARQAAEAARKVVEELECQEAAAQAQHELEMQQQLAELERRYVQAQMEDALKELGLNVGESFETVDGQTTVFVPDLPDNPGYGLQLRIQPDNANPAQGKIFTQIVAERPTTAAQDKQVEEQACDKVVFGLANQMAQRGVQTNVFHQLAPGERRLAIRNADGTLVQQVGSSQQPGGAQQQAQVPPQRETQAAPHRRKNTSERTR